MSACRSKCWRWAELKIMTDSTAQFPPSPARLSMTSLDPLLVLTIVAVVFGSVLRATHGDAPLWLDETFTGAIASEPSLPAVLYQILQDINAPLYYLIAHYWSLLFGLSNEALRFPALLFALMAPLLCLLPVPGVSRRMSLVWCALTALWIPGLFLAQEARGYSLLLCLSIGMTLAFIKLLDDPTTKRAAVWALLATGAILTHYDALILVGFQGLAYLALRRQKALRTWPAAFVFLPAVGWLAVHAHRIIQLADPQLAWYPLLQARRLIFVFACMAGSFAVASMLVVFAMIAAILVIIRWPPAGLNLRKMPSAAGIAVLAAFMGAASLILIGFLRPSFAERYLVLFIPGFLLALAITAEKLKWCWQTAPITLILVFTIGAVLATAGGLPDSKSYNFEAASQALIEAKTNKLVFLWDHPANVAEDKSQLQLVGGFFFRRQGIDIEVKPLQPAHGEDPNMQLLEAAKEPFTSILWLYDQRIRNTAATLFPPKMTELDPAWKCHDFGVAPVGIVACHKEPT